MWGDVMLGCGWPKSNEGGGLRQRGHQCFFLFSQNNSFLAILKSQPLLQVLHFFHHIFKKRLTLSVPLIFSHLSNNHSLGEFKRNDMSMFTQTTTGRVDQLGSLSQKHKHTKHTKYKHTAQSHTGTWWSPEIGTKSWPAIALMVVATLGEQFSQKTWAQSKGEKALNTKYFDNMNDIATCCPRCSKSLSMEANPLAAV